MMHDDLIDENVRNGDDGYDGDDGHASAGVAGKAAGALAMLAAVGAGATLMYLLDPDRGARRRAMLRERVTSSLREADERFRATRRDLANRARGKLAETRSRLTPEDVDDEVIVGRVRAELGHHVSHSGALEVESSRSVVTIGGPVLADEVDTVLQVARKVRGVREVVSRLEVHETAGNVPGLQGGDGASAAR